MSKITLALGSFIVGAMTMLFLFSGSHASMWAQESTKPGPGLEMPFAIPTVPPLRHVVLEGNEFVGVEQQLDGLNCKGCKFRDVVLTYGGGAYALSDCVFSGRVRIALSGAAGNTVAILPLLQAITVGKPPEAPKPKAPINKEATAKNTLTVSFTTPFGQN